MSTIDNSESVELGVIACTTSAQNKKVRTWKKPIGKPKRPLSAYNIYFQLERDRIVHGEEEKIFSKADVDKVRIIPVELMPKRRDRKTHGKVGFGDLAKMIGSKWKQLSDEEKLAFNERAKLEKIRYKRDVEEWVQRTIEAKDCNQGEISEDPSNGIKDSTQCMAFGGQLGRIFLGTDTFKPDHAHQSIYPGHDDHCEVAAESGVGYQYLLGATKYECDIPIEYNNLSISKDNCFQKDIPDQELDFESVSQFRRNMSFEGMKKNMNMRDLIMNQQYVHDYDEAVVAGSINTEKYSISTKRTYDRAMAVYGDVQSTVGFGCGRNRSLVGNHVSMYPLFHQRVPVSYTLRPMSKSQIAAYKNQTYQNIKGSTFTGHPLRKEDDYRRSRENQLQITHSFLSEREVDNNNFNCSLISGGVNMNDDQESSYRPLATLDLPKNYNSVFGCEYGKVPQDELEDDYDASESIHTSSQNNSGTFYGSS